MLDMLSSISAIDLSASSSSIVVNNSSNESNEATLQSFRKCSVQQQVKSESIDSCSRLEVEPAQGLRKEEGCKVVNEEIEDKEATVRRKPDNAAGNKQEESHPENRDKAGAEAQKEQDDGKGNETANETDGEIAEVAPETRQPVSVRVQCSQTQFGESVYIIGEWINWEVNRAIKLDGSEWPIWKGSFTAERITGTEYKYYILSADGKTKVWESIPKQNRLFVGKKAIEDIFGSPLTEEEALALSQTIDYPIPLFQLAKSQFKVLKAAYKGVLVAMKVFPMNTPKAIKQAMNEAQTLGCMDHTCIVRIFCAYYDKADDVVC